MRPDKAHRFQYSSGCHAASPRVVSVDVQDHDCLVEGPLDNMQTSLMSFPPPLNRRNDTRRLYFTALAQGTHAAANSQVICDLLGVVFLSCVPLVVLLVVLVDMS